MSITSFNTRSVLSVAIARFVHLVLVTAPVRGEILTPVPEDCVFQGYWRVRGGVGVDLIVHMDKVRHSAFSASWNVTVLEGHTSNLTLPPRPAKIQPADAAEAPCLCVDDETGDAQCRHDTSGPWLNMGFGVSDEMGAMWLGRMSPARSIDLEWRTPSNPDHQGLCPLSGVNELFGQRSWSEDGHTGCTKLTARRIGLEEAPVDEGGYIAMAEEKSVYVMTHYVHRVVKSLGWNITDDGGLTGFTPWYCGVKVCDGKKCYKPPPHQSLQKMMFELAEAKWVHQADNAKQTLLLTMVSLHFWSLIFMTSVGLCCFALNLKDRGKCCEEAKR